jgi:putative transposase
MRLLDEEHTAHPFYGSRRLTAWLVGRGEAVNGKRVQRLLRVMGLEAIYPKPRLSTAGRGHKIYPYLLRDVAVERPDQIWSADITYVPLASGFLYLAATIDWYSRLVVAWRLSNTLDGSFCLEMLEEALSTGRPEVFNTDQGAQFTAAAGTGRLESAGVAVSMDGRGRCLDNVFVERPWRSVKYEEVYLQCYEGVPQLQRGWGATSPSTTASGCTSRWTTGRREPATKRTDRSGRDGCRVRARSDILFSPAAVSSGEGPRGEKGCQGEV